jgi:hypothetical protein
MIKIERFYGKQELDKLLKVFVSIPTNTGNNRSDGIF